jgi:hypothetical protein
LNTSIFTLDAVRLGPSTGNVGPNGAGSIYFDEFESFMEILVTDAIPVDFKFYLPLIVRPTFP